jgi:geranylgeranyl diphosphate synthase, type II
MGKELSLQIGSAAPPGGLRGPPLDSDADSPAARHDEVSARGRARIASRLDDLVPPVTAEPRRLHQAMRYSLLAPGKRVRPALTLLTTGIFGGNEEAALDPACAIEMVHTASLIFDDLPSMDNATLRRGRPANHRTFGEATAALAGIALLNRAYGVIAEAPGLSSRTRTSLVALLSRAVGTDGAVAGQFRDLDGDAKADVEALGEVEGLKTAALFVAAVEAGAIVAGLQEDSLAPVRRFGWNLGLAFQLRDDRIDAVSTREEAGKDVRQDDAKVTLVTVLGIERAGTLLDKLLDDAAAALAPLGRDGHTLARTCRDFLSR